VLLAQGEQDERQARLVALVGRSQDRGSDLAALLQGLLDPVTFLTGLLDGGEPAPWLSPSPTV